MATREEREAELTRLCDRVREINHAPGCRCWDCKAFLVAFAENKKQTRIEIHRELYGDDNPFDEDGNLITKQYPVRMK